MTLVIQTDLGVILRCFPHIPHLISPLQLTFRVYRVYLLLAIFTPAILVQAAIISYPFLVSLLVLLTSINLFPYNSQNSFKASLSRVTPYLDSFTGFSLSLEWKSEHLTVVYKAYKALSA